MALIMCKECGTEVSQKARSCPKCAAPVPRKTSAFTWLVTILLGLWFIGWISSQGPSTGGSTEAPKPPESAYPIEHNLDYRAAALGQMPKATLLTFEGRVVQKIGTYNARVATKQRRKPLSRYVDDDVYLVFDSQPQILDDDIIRVLGRYDGTLKYETVLRTERVIPRIRVDYFQVVSQR